MLLKIYSQNLTSCHCLNIHCVLVSQESLHSRLSHVRTTFPAWLNELCSSMFIICWLYQNTCRFTNCVILLLYATMKFILSFYCASVEESDSSFIVGLCERDYTLPSSILSLHLCWEHILDYINSSQTRHFVESFPCLLNVPSHPRQFISVLITYSIPASFSLKKKLSVHMCVCVCIYIYIYIYI